MCGIAGFSNCLLRQDEATSILHRMTNALTHRGPDASGVWSDPEAGIYLGHRRLAIVDLSEQGRQPMQSACGRYEIVFNGEIYNFQQLRAELEENLFAAWRGHSDTEVMLEGFRQWGVTSTLEKLTGMFAFALWDKRDEQLILARDRLGEKPLYYAIVGRSILFASEQRAFQAFPGWQGDVDRDVLATYVRHGYIPAPHSIYLNAKKLPPGTFLEFKKQVGRSLDSWPLPKKYWAARDVVQGSLQTQSGLADDVAVEKLDELLQQSVRQQMLADVPVGAFLSGGVDSSTIVGIMQKLSVRPVKTFSIGFEHSEYNEAEYAKEVARHLGTDHHEFYVTARDALDVIPHLPRIYDEPFADSSQIPTFLVSKLTRNRVTVALSGDGGDELFGGYERYQRSSVAWKRIRRIPYRLRQVVGYGGGWLARLSANDRWSEVCDSLSCNSCEEFYRRRISQSRFPEAIVLGATEASTIFSERQDWIATKDDYHRMMFLDMMSYLPDDILAKVDRASMAVSLETRLPLLSHRVVEFAWSLPLSLKVRDGQTKWILRQVLQRYVPAEFFDRPKTGFAVPLQHWLRGPLREWAESLLDETRLHDDGYFAPELVRRLWNQFLRVKSQPATHIWTLLMFQAWLDEQRGTASDSILAAA
ncbi:MAG: asparagine synthase (glutamine-hydrolyzing) [Pirellulaceae bacterium]|jgi:asparagine synthase (glutamine-hydrolysing)